MRKNWMIILAVFVTLLVMFVTRATIFNKVIERSGYWQGDNTAHITERVMKVDLRGRVISTISEKEFTVKNVSFPKYLNDDIYSY